MAGKKTPIAETFVSVVPETAQVRGAVERAFRSTDDDVKAAARRWRRDIETELAKIDALEIDADTDAADDKIKELEAKLKKAGKVKVDVDVDKERLAQAAGTVGSTIAKTLAGATAGALGTQLIVGGVGGLVALTGALLPAVGALAMIPAVASAAGLAIGTLKIATAGFGDAVKAGASGDPKAYAEAIAKLAPNAQQAALAIGALKPATDALKNTLGNNFMDGFSGQIEKLGGTYLPILEGAMGSMASSANVAVRQVGDLLQAPKSVADVTTLTGNAAKGFDGLTGALKPVVGAFLDVATVGSDFLPALGEGARKAGESFGTMIAEARDSGKITEVIETGIDVLKDFGAVLGNVGGIFGGIFNAGRDVGGGMLESLKSVTGSLDDLVNSVAGQDALGKFFTSASDALGMVLPMLDTVLTSVVGTVLPAFLDLGTAVGPALQTALTTLADVMNVLAPVLVSLGGPIDQILAALGPALLESVEGLAPSIGPLATAFADIVTALSPLLPLLSDVTAALATSLAGAVSTATDVLGPLIGFFHDNEGAALAFKVALGAVVTAWGAMKAVLVIDALVTSLTAGFAAIIARVGATTVAYNALATSAGAAATAQAAAAGATGLGIAALAAPAAVVAAGVGVAVVGDDYTRKRDLQKDLEFYNKYDAPNVPHVEGSEQFGTPKDMSYAAILTAAQKGELPGAHATADGVVIETATGAVFGARGAMPAGATANPAASVPASGSIPSDTLARKDVMPADVIPLPPAVVSAPSNSSYALPTAPATSAGSAAAPASSSSSYGLPVGTTIAAGGEGFPQWVYDLASQYGLKAATYSGHQEGSGANKGIDWTGTPENMHRFAQDLAARGGMEQVIWQNPNTGEKIGVANGQRVGPGTSQPGYYANDFGGHQDHVHTRQSSPVGMGPSGSYASPMATAYDTGIGGSTDKQLRDAAQKVDDANADIISKQQALDEVNAKGTATLKQKTDATNALNKAIREQKDAVEDLATAQNKPVKGDKSGDGEFGDLGSILGGGLAEMFGFDGSLFKAPGELGIAKLMQSFMKVGPKDGGGDGSVLPAGGSGGGGILNALGPLGSQPFGAIGGTESQPGAAFATPGSGGNVVDAATAFLPPGGGVAGPGNAQQISVDQSVNVTGNTMGPTLPDVTNHLQGQQLAGARPALRQF